MLEKTTIILFLNHILWLHFIIWFICRQLITKGWRQYLNFGVFWSPRSISWNKKLLSKLIPPCSSHGKHEGSFQFRNCRNCFSVPFPTWNKTSNCFSVPLTDGNCFTVLIPTFGLMSVLGGWRIVKFIFSKISVFKSKHFKNVI